MKPSCKLSGENGNIYNLGAIVLIALRRAPRTEERCDDCWHRFACWTDNEKCLLVNEFAGKMLKCHSYEEALTLMQEYVEVE